MKPGILLILIFSIFQLSSWSQSSFSIDSLELELEFAESPTQEVEILLKLASLKADYDPLYSLNIANQAKDIAGKNGLISE